MGDSMHSDRRCRSIHYLLAFSHKHDGCFGRFVWSFIVKPFKKLAHIRNHWHLPDLTILCSSFRIAPHNEFPSDEITICPSDVCRFSFSKATVSQEPNRGSASF